VDVVPGTEPLSEAYTLRNERMEIANEALPQTDEVYAEDGALIAIANDRWTPIEPAGTMP
jgi:hypothetical protein